MGFLPIETMGQSPRGNPQPRRDTACRVPTIPGALKPEPHYVIIVVKGLVPVKAGVISSAVFPKPVSGQTPVSPSSGSSKNC